MSAGLGQPTSPRWQPWIFLCKKRFQLRRRYPLPARLPPSWSEKPKQRRWRRNPFGTNKLALGAGAEAWPAFRLIDPGRPPSAAPAASPLHLPHPQPGSCPASEATGAWNSGRPRELFQGLRSREPEAREKFWKGCCTRDGRVPGGHHPGCPIPLGD